MKKFTKHSKRAKAYKDGWLDACVACIEIVMPIPAVQDTRSTRQIAAELIELMMRKCEGKSACL